MAMKRFRNKALVVSMLSVLAMPAAALAQEAENAETVVEVTDTIKDESESHKVRELKKRVQELEGQLEEQAREHLALMEEVDSLSARQRAIEEGDSISRGYPATDSFLVEQLIETLHQDRKKRNHSGTPAGKREAHSLCQKLRSNEAYAVVEA